MLRQVTRLLSIVSIILLLGFIAIVIILNTSLLKPTTNALLQYWLGPNTHVENVAYTSPNHLKLYDVTLENGDIIESVDSWLTLYPTQFKQLEFDALLLNGLTLTSDGFNTLPIRQWKIHQLSLDNVTLNIERWKAVQADIQWQNPQWKQDQILPNGIFQAHANILVWDDQLPLNDVLINGTFNDTQQRLSGLSLKWKDSHVEAQATRDRNRWIINDVTIENLLIEEYDISPELKQQLKQWVTSIDSIERFDLLRGQIQWYETTLNNLELSATNFDPNNLLIWQQFDTSISFKADSIDNQGILWTDPNIKLTLKPNSIDIDDMSIGLSGGDIHLSAHFEPTLAEIYKLDIIAVKHAIEQEQPHYSAFSNYIQQLDQLHVDKLRLLNGQLIQLAQKPYWQFSGVNLEFLNADLVQDNHWGLWNGHFSVSVNSLSYDSVLATQAIIEMNSNGQDWNMSRAFIPFTKGYLSAQGQWRFGQNGQPWNVVVETDSFPLQLFKNTPLPLNVDGIIDMQLSANGLSGDETILRHTLTGELDLSLRDGTFKLKQKGKNDTHSFGIEHWHIQSHKGEVTTSKANVVGDRFNGVLEGEYDLSTEKENQGFSLSYRENGLKKTINVLHSTE
ncbi:AsmA family protein [Vibrio sp. WJH972]